MPTTNTCRNNALEVGLRDPMPVADSMSIVINGAAAKDRNQGGSANESQLVAHISFGSQRAVDMAIQKDANNKMYLYVDHSRDEGISVIDVTQPAKPKILGFVSWPNRAVASQVNITGRLGIFTEGGGA